MSEYHLEIKQLVDYPRCRIYREFVQSLIADRSIRTNGGSGLFYYTVLSCYIEHEQGGAYEAVEYAKKNEKCVINLFD